MPETMNAVVVSAHGGPENLEFRRVARPAPEAGQVLVKLSVAGVNYLDVAQRNGATTLQAPFRAGVEGVGVIAALGTEVTGFAEGQRVGWLAGGQGSFSEFTVVEAPQVVAIPEGIDDFTAVAALMQGFTAHYLSHDTYALGPDDTVLIHAAAGGVGQWLTQLAKLKGARVIGTVSSPAKEDAARTNGVDHVIGYDGFAENVRGLTGGEGASVVYDGVGQATFAESLRALRIRGMLVAIGAASGPIPPLDVNSLAGLGSLAVTRPTVSHHVRTAEEISRRASDLFGWIATGAISVPPVTHYDITQAVQAFTALESRRTTGKVVLVHSS
ncbi:quinone oxidoreductase [Arthrobacter sp. UCD-GKA]|uniref:quinone oxidoreductase family protein n=1 Tax=Arthrobacter sp. UCD-GKA TaxID=1913576 RepID=UPI000A57B85B|nr:quinone oxidoreductase [Arthrobacter sp. UCD-GKA]